MEEEKKEKGFVIRDRRLFDETGEARRDDPEPAASTAAEKTAPTGEQIGAADATSPAEDLGGYLPEVNFLNFILSLSTTAMYHFGDFPDPASGQAKKNMAAAKHTIDTISMLENKTKGNLDNDEKNMLDAVLFELRMRYVKESSTPSS
mgnify:CR=1 FL=1